MDEKLRIRDKNRLSPISSKKFSESRIAAVSATGEQSCLWLIYFNIFVQE